jgi:hypothetical protein
MDDTTKQESLTTKTKKQANTTHRRSLNRF